jgi:hypothetical protein
MTTVLFLGSNLSEEIEVPLSSLMFDMDFVDDHSVSSVWVNAAHFFDLVTWALELHLQNFFENVNFWPPPFFCKELIISQKRDG